MTASDPRAAWDEFRTRRETELAEPYGWLTLTAFHWLPDAPGSVPGLPGVWWSDGTSAHVRAEATAGLVDAEGAAVTGSTCTVAETARTPWLTTGTGERVELMRRGGRLAIRTRSETSAAREQFAGVPVYPFDPAWIVEGRFEPAEDGATVEVGTHRPDLRQRLRAPGRVTFRLGGQDQSLLVTSIKTGLSVEFHDPTNGVETPAWRQLKFADPDAAGRVVLDFNRTINMWFAFTDHATCPRPAEGNVISVPVRAGERS